MERFFKLKQKTKYCSCCKKTRVFSKFYNDRHSKTGKGTYCKRCHTSYTERHRKRNQKRITEQAKKNYKELTDKVLVGYGHKCACCGEIQREFLTIDHVNGGGRLDREKRAQSTIRRQIIKDGFPKTFRLLCYNCNCSLGHYGYCPHDK